MTTWWHGDPLNLEVVKTDFRNAMRSTHPADVLHARFPYVPEETRASYIDQWTTQPDERRILAARFAEVVEAFWNEQRDRSQSVLRRVWRLFG